MGKMTDIHTLQRLKGYLLKWINLNYLLYLRPFCLVLFAPKNDIKMVFNYHLKNQEYETKENNFGLLHCDPILIWETETGKQPKRILCSSPWMKTI